MAYYIIYPSGDRGKISVVEIPPALDYELGDYDRASRKDFVYEKEASTYARELAKKHGKEYIYEDEEEFLD